MKMHLLKGRNRSGYAVFSTIWNKGEVKDGECFTLTDSEGKEIPVQSRTAAYYPDGSVKWAFHAADTNALTDEITIEKGGNAPLDKLQISEDEEAIRIKGHHLSFTAPKEGGHVLEDISIDSRTISPWADLPLVMEEHDGNVIRRVDYMTDVKSAVLEVSGPIYATVAIRGIHRSESGRKLIPFILRVSIGYESEKLDIEHTMILDVDAEHDFLKGLGMRFAVKMSGMNANRHFETLLDHGVFHECSDLLLTWRPKPDIPRYEAQLRGERVEESQEISDSIPSWDSWMLYQAGPEGFSIRKKTGIRNVSSIPACYGHRAPGAVAVGSENGSLMLLASDFWERFPASLWAEDVTKDEAKLSFWFITPDAEAYDFRHYTDTGYDQTYYEGFPVKGGDPDGIASTTRFSVMPSLDIIPSEEKMAKASAETRKPAVYVLMPEEYHKKRAFGYWSLPSRSTEMENWVEDQLEKAFDFCRKEIERRSWYGYFNYGDFMHTYDEFRHVWRYDMGGYAWQNTELCPTYWLWLYFLRTGREDVFSIAEAMVRHTSETDIYHSGRFLGLGSRHNVIHWGCSCKEARIAMAGHDRFCYYLTGDPRLGEVMEEVKDAETALLETDPLRFFYDRNEMEYPTHARSGPDWSALVSNWMTEWERHNDKRYLDKIQAGIETIAKAPLRLVSGPDFEFDPATCRLRYIGERTTGGTHLQVCLGASEIWTELAILLDNPEWSDMVAELGRFYYLDRDEQMKASDGIIGDRAFTLPFMAAAIAAYGAKHYDDHETGRKVWRNLFGLIMKEGVTDGFTPHIEKNAGNQAELEELDWAKTNLFSQWCLNAIVALDFVRDDMPRTIEKALELVKDYPADLFHSS